MDKQTALIQKVDPGALNAYIQRIENGEQLDEVLAELVKKAAEGTGAAGRINERLRDLITDEALEFDQGVFIAPFGVDEESAKRIIGTTVRLFNDTEGVGNMGRWVLGNIATIIEEAGFTLTDLIEPTQLAYNTIAKSAKTFKFFAAKRYKLPFAHHAEIAYAKDLPDEARHAVMQHAEDKGLPVIHTRKMARAMRDRLLTNPEITDWKAEAEAADELVTAAITHEQPPESFGVVGPNGLYILHRKPTEAEMAEATEVFKIGRYLKREAPTDARADGGGDADG